MDDNIALYAFRKFGDTILRAAYACCGNYSEAEDITQDVFLILHSKPQTFRDDEHMKAWLLRAAINKCKNYKKKLPFQSYRQYRRRKQKSAEMQFHSP